jgi:hypothetical protein
MLSREEFIRLSLELNLFFARIAKEHSIFLESGFTGRDVRLAGEADNFKEEFERLLAEAAALSNGLISHAVASSGELTTPYTLSAERISSFYTGIRINTGLTQVEAGIGGNMNYAASPMLEQKVGALNQKAIALTNKLIGFKSNVLNSVLSCRLFTFNYPLLIDHILREARFYVKMLTKLQKRESILTEQDLLEQEVFWNRIMAEHSKFIRGLLDPTEENLINTANRFGKEFDDLTRQAINAVEQTNTFPEVTAESLNAANGLRDFKAAGTKGLIECNIRAIAVPLLGDHVLREANHYIRILKMFSH